MSSFFLEDDDCRRANREKTVKVDIVKGLMKEFALVGRNEYNGFPFVRQNQ